MAKRFTDTDKWKHKSFRSKCPKCKLFWIYILDNCDYAGIWNVDFELASFHIGAELDENFILNSLKDDIVLLDNGKRWFVPAFISYQYGRQLSRKNQIHMRVIKVICDYDLEDHIEEIDIVDEINTASAIRSRITKKLRLHIYSRDEYTCQYCSGKFSENELTLDHVIPIEKDGQNTEENLVTACKNCNGKKTGLDLEIFLFKNKNLNPTSKILERCGKVINVTFNDNLAEKSPYLPQIRTLSTLKEEEEEEDKDKVEEKAKEEVEKEVEVEEKEKEKKEDWKPDKIPKGNLGKKQNKKKRHKKRKRR